MISQMVQLPIMRQWFKIPTTAPIEVKKTLLMTFYFSATSVNFVLSNTFLVKKILWPKAFTMKILFTIPISEVSSKRGKCWLQMTTYVNQMNGR